LSGIFRIEKIMRLFRVGFHLNIFPTKPQVHKEISIDSNHFVILVPLWDKLLHSS
jgi:hypothetical protein